MKTPAKATKAPKVVAPKVAPKATPIATATAKPEVVVPVTPTPVASTKPAAPVKFVICTKPGSHKNPFTVGSKTFAMFDAAQSANGVSVAELEALDAQFATATKPAGSGSVSRMREILTRPSTKAAKKQLAVWQINWSVETTGAPADPAHRYRIVASSESANAAFVPVRTRK